MFQDSICCVIGNNLYVFKNNQCEGHVLHFEAPIEYLDSKGNVRQINRAENYARQAKMDIMKPEDFIAYCETLP